MPKIIAWSPDAEVAYLETLEFILDNFSQTVALSLDNELNKHLDIISNFPYRWPVSIEIGLRRAVIKEHYLLIYRVNLQSVEIVDFIDARSDHPY